MKRPPDRDPSSRANLVGLAAVVVLVVLAIWLLVAFKHSSDTLDCIAAGHHNCVPVQ